MKQVTIEFKYEYAYPGDTSYRGKGTFRAEGFKEEEGELVFDEEAVRDLISDELNDLEIEEINIYDAEEVYEDFEEARCEYWADMRREDYE